MIELREERKNLVNNLRHVDAALAVLGKLEEGKFATESRRGRSTGGRHHSASSGAGAKRKRAARKGRPMSAAVKAKLRAAYAANHPGWKPKR